MSQFCTQFDATGPYIRGVLGYVDCQTANLAEQGFRAIGAGTQFAQALDATLVIAVALFGYRMLMGRTPALRDGMVLVIKIGFVLALAQHWSAYQPVIFNVATRAPQTLVGEILGQAGSQNGSAEDALVSRAETVDATLGAILYPERGGNIQRVSPVQSDAANPAGSELAPESRELLSSANRIMMLTFLSAAVGLRIALAVLLSLAPLFIASLLFDTVRTLFAGWLRALMGTMAGLVAVPVVTAFELALLEPQVIALSRAFAASNALGSLPERLWVTSSLFAAAMALVLLLVGRAAAKIRFTELGRAVIGHIERQAPMALSNNTMEMRRQPALSIRDHAQHVADAARAAERRDEAAMRPASVVNLVERRLDGRQGQALAPAGVQHRTTRAASGRKSAASQRRDLT